MIVSTESSSLLYQIAKEWDECAVYEHVIQEIPTPTSICGSDGFCTDIVSMLEGGQISCHAAYTHVIENQKIRIDSPPILSIADRPSIIQMEVLEGVYLDESHSSTGHSSFDQVRRTMEKMIRLPEPIRLLYAHLASNLEIAANRMLNRFPRIVYVDEVDGHALRTIAEMSDSLHRYISARHEIRSMLFESRSMRKFAWTIAMTFNHLINENMTLRDSENFLLSLAPYVHAFMYVNFQFGLHFPNMMKPFDSIITSIVQFNPLYTSDEWMLRLERIPPRLMINLYIVVARQDLDLMWEDLGEDLHQSPARLVRDLRTHMTVATVIRHMTFRLDLILYTIKFYADFEPEMYQEMVDVHGLLDIGKAFLDVAHQFPDLADLVKAIIVRLPSRNLPDQQYLDKVLHPYSDTFARVPMTSRSYETTIRYREFGDILTTFATLDISQLAGKIVFTPHETRRTHRASLSSFYTSLLEYIFATYFVTIGEEVKLKLSIAHPTIQRAIGRIFGLVIRDGNPGSVLNSHFIQPFSKKFGAIFFDSPIIKSGFHDIFHLSATSIYSTANLGEVLHLLSQWRVEFTSAKPSVVNH